MGAKKEEINNKPASTHCDAGFCCLIDPTTMNLKLGCSIYPI